MLLVDGIDIKIDQVVAITIICMFCLKLTELNVVTYASWYRVNKASGYDLLCNADKLIDQSRDT